MNPLSLSLEGRDPSIWGIGVKRAIHITIMLRLSYTVRSARHGQFDDGLYGNVRLTVVQSDTATGRIADA